MITRSGSPLFAAAWAWRFCPAAEVIKISRKISKQEKNLGRASCSMVNFLYEG
jgi:hypothetical protein